MQVLTYVFTRKNDFWTMFFETSFGGLKKF